MKSVPSSTRSPYRRQFLVGLVGLLVVAGILIGINLPTDQPTGQGSGSTPTTASPAPSAINFASLLAAPLNGRDVEVLADGLDNPHGLGLAGGLLFVSDWGAKTISKVDLATSQRQVFAREVDSAHDMVIDADGSVVTPLYRQNRLVRIDAGSGAVSQIVGGLSGPNGIAAASDGFYVSNAVSGTVVKVSRDGRVTEIARGLREPAGIAVDQTGVLVAQFADAQRSVVRISGDGTITPVVRGLAQAESLQYDQAGNLLIGHTEGGRAAASVFTASGELRSVLTTELPGPMVGPFSDGRHLYFESAKPGQRRVYRIKLP